MFKYAQGEESGMIRIEKRGERREERGEERDKTTFLSVCVWLGDLQIKYKFF
jgi:hypothetical protein